MKNNYTSTKYENFTVAAELSPTNHILIYSTHRGDRNILIYDIKNLPIKIEEIILYHLLEDKYEYNSHTLDYIKEHFTVEREL